MEKRSSIYTTLADYLVEFGLYAIVLGLFLSNALKSIGVVTVCISILFHKNTLRNAKKLPDNPLYLAAGSLALIYILSIFNTTDYHTYWSLTNIKWLYFFFPLAMANYTFSKRSIRNLVSIGIACALFQSFYSMYYLYLYDKETLWKIYATGNIINTFKIHHVQISILDSIVILMLYAQLLQKGGNPRWKILGWVVCIWLFFAVHLYAVRSGILLTYLFLIGYTIFYIKSISLKNGLFLSGFILLGVILLLSLSTIQDRIGYLKYDFDKYISKSKDAIEYSDGRRLISINVGMQLIQNYKWTGCGLGEIKNASAAIYKKYYPDLDENYYYLPHSQYIFFGACYGIFLGIIVCLLFIYPCFYFFQKRNYLFFIISFGLMLFALWDAWLGTLFGNCLYLLLIGFGSKNKWA